MEDIQMIQEDTQMADPLEPAAQRNGSNGANGLENNAEMATGNPGDDDDDDDGENPKPPSPIEIPLGNVAGQDEVEQNILENPEIMAAILQQQLPLQASNEPTGQVSPAEQQNVEESLQDVDDATQQEETQDGSDTTNKSKKRRPRKDSSGGQDEDSGGQSGTSC